MSDTDTAERSVFTALPKARSKVWRSPADVATDTGHGYSTVTRHLRALVAAGSVVAEKQGKTTMYRQSGQAPPADKPAKGETLRQFGKPVREPSPRKAKPRANDTSVVDEVTVEPDVTDAGPGAESTAEATPAVPELVQRLWPDGTVWMATRRQGLEFHALADAPTARTVCDRSAASQTSWFGSINAAVSAGAKPCPRCTAWLEEAGTEEATAAEAATVEEAVDAGEPVRADAPAAADELGNVDAGTAAGDTGWIPAGARRTSAEARVFEAAVKAKTWPRGALRDAVAGYLLGLPDGYDATPGQVATALVADMAPVATNLMRMVRAGTVVQTSTDPRRYRAVRAT